MAHEQGWSNLKCDSEITKRQNNKVGKEKEVRILNALIVLAFILCSVFLTVKPFLEKL